MRTWLLVALAWAAPAAALGMERAREVRPVLEDAAAVNARAAKLDLEAHDLGVGTGRLHEEAAVLFERDVNGPALPAVRAAYSPMAREPVDGRKATAQSMMDALNATFRRESPPPPVAEGLGFAETLYARGDLAIRRGLAPSVMGLYLYDAASADSPGRVVVNRLLAEAARWIGPRFAGVTLIHEGDHAARRELHHQLAAGENLNDETHAFYAQYLAVKLLDPRCERLDRLYISLGFFLRRHPGVKAAVIARAYVRNLIKLWDTHGKRQALLDFVKGIGYEERAPEDEPAPLSAPSA